MKNARFLLTACSFACMATTPAAAKSNHNGPEYLSATRISYFLPKTKVTATLSLILRNCGQSYDAKGTSIPKLNPDDPDTPQVAATLTVAASGVADRSTRYDIAASNLQSWRVKRNVDLTVNDNGTLAGINSSVTDQTASIFGSVLKFVASIIVPLADTHGKSLYQCNADTAAADKEARTLEARIAETRRKMLEDDKDKPDKWKDDLGLIDAMATRVATLRTGPLLVTVTKDLAIVPVANGSPASLSFASPDLDKWFSRAETAQITAARLSKLNGPPQPGVTPLTAATAGAIYPDWFRLSYTLERKSPLPAGTTDPFAGTGTWTNSLTTVETPTAAAEGKDCPDDARCERTIAFRAPIDATLAIYCIGFVQQPADVPMLVLDVPVGQWGTKTYLSLDAKLLSNRTVNMTVDGFGRVKTLTWQSEARGQTLAGALGAAADSMGSVRKAIAGETDVQRQADQVTKLDTQRKLNALLACQEAINAGGFTCPGTGN